MVADLSCHRVLSSFLYTGMLPDKFSFLFNWNVPLRRMLLPPSICVLCCDGPSPVLRLPRTQRPPRDAGGCKGPGGAGNGKAMLRPLSEIVRGIGLKVALGEQRVKGKRGPGA